MPLEEAKRAIVEPMEHVGLHYDPDLLDELIVDLSLREQQEHYGLSAGELQEGLPAYVEPLHLQIVCTELWEALKYRSDHTKFGMI